MALTRLVDTSVLTRLKRPEVRGAIEPGLEAGELARATISDLEIGYSARNTVEWDHLMEALEAFELVETTADHLRRARQVQRLLAARRQRGRKVPDLLIARGGGGPRPRGSSLRRRLRSNCCGDRPDMPVGGTCRVHKLSCVESAGPYSALDDITFAAA